MSIRTKKWLLLSGIAVVSMTSFSALYSADLNFILKTYGLLFTCQIGFLLFFLNQLPLRKRRS